MPGWFANGRADKERLGGNARDKAAAPGQKTGSGFTKREGITRKVVDRVKDAIIDNTTGRITNSKVIRGLKNARGRIKRGECIYCGAKLRGNKTYARDFGAWEDANPGKNAVVCSKKCAFKAEAAGYDDIQKHMDKLAKENAARGRIATHADWLKITGGIQYDEDGKRIW